METRTGEQIPLIGCASESCERDCLRAGERGRYSIDFGRDTFGDATKRCLYAVARRVS